MNRKLESLLSDLIKDYNHPWPNEDELTKKHRETMLIRIHAHLFKVVNYNQKRNKKS